VAHRLLVLLQIVWRAPTPVVAQEFETLVVSVVILVQFHRTVLLLFKQFVGDAHPDYSAD
jgi:hypothetical protein